MRLLLVLCIAVSLSGCRHSPVNEVISKVSDVPISRVEADQAAGAYTRSKTLPDQKEEASEYRNPAVPASKVFELMDEMIREGNNPPNGDYSVTWDVQIHEDPLHASWSAHWLCNYQVATKTLRLSFQTFVPERPPYEDTYSGVTPQMISQLAKQPNCQFDDLQSCGPVTKLRNEFGKH